MNRRQFVKSFVGAVATVAIGLKLAEPMPKWIGIDWGKKQSWTVMARRRGKPQWTANYYQWAVLNNKAVGVIDWEQNA